jgi:hypothetical protein
MYNARSKLPAGFVLLARRDPAVEPNCYTVRIVDPVVLRACRSWCALAASRNG